MPRIRPPELAAMKAAEAKKRAIEKKRKAFAISEDKPNPKPKPKKKFSGGRAKAMVDDQSDDDESSKRPSRKKQRTEKTGFPLDDDEDERKPAAKKALPARKHYNSSTSDDSHDSDIEFSLKSMEAESNSVLKKSGKYVRPAKKSADPYDGAIAKAEKEISKRSILSHFLKGDRAAFTHTLAYLKKVAQLRKEKSDTDLIIDAPFEDDLTDLVEMQRTLLFMVELYEATGEEIQLTESGRSNCSGVMKAISVFSSKCELFFYNFFFLF
jgi:hypothetical protein